MPDPPAKRPLDDSAQAGVGRLNYTDLPGLEDVFLEDSLVRDIVETAEFVSFTLLVVLTPSHPAYERPPHLERHCFRTATLTFPRPRKVTWHERRDARFVDALGAVDLGNIDAFVATPLGHYRVEGDFGVVDIASLAAQLDLVAIETPSRLAVELRAWVEGREPPPAHDHDHDHGHAHATRNDAP